MRGLPKREGQHIQQRVLAAYQAHAFAFLLCRRSGDHQGQQLATSLVHAGQMGLKRERGGLAWRTSAHTLVRYPQFGAYIVLPDNWPWWRGNWR